MGVRAVPGWRLVATVAAVTLAGLVVTGCSSDEGAVHDTASDFVSALVDGRHADAVALSDAGVNDFACSWLVADRRLGAWFNASVESVSVDEGGAQAQAQVTTQAVDGTEDEMSFDLVRGETEWKVVLPESYRI